MAYNLYRGNGSRAERMGDSSPPRRGMKPDPPSVPLLGNLPKKLSELDTEDMLLILILYFLYRESGDTELLLMIGAMYLI